MRVSFLSDISDLRKDRYWTKQHFCIRITTHNGYHCTHHCLGELVEVVVIDMTEMTNGRQVLSRVDSVQSGILRGLVPLLTDKQTNIRTVHI